MKIIKLITIIVVALTSTFGNTYFGYAATTPPAGEASAVTFQNEPGDEPSNDESSDSRADAAAPPVALQYIVKFRSASKASAAQAVISPLSGNTAHINGALSGQTFLVTFADQAQLNALLAQTTGSEPAKTGIIGNTGTINNENSESEIEYLVPNLRRSLALTPDDTEFERQVQSHTTTSNTVGTNLEPAWNLTTGSADIVIAVLDTGIRYEHPDLAGRLLPGYDLVSTAEMGNDGDGRDADPSDPGDWVTPEESAQVGNTFYRCTAANSRWHGTHVAGIIGAQGNNGLGVAGANWVSKILPVRVLGKCGGYDSDIIDGIRWAAGLNVPGLPVNPTPANIINLSLGGSGTCNAAYQDAINEVTAAGVVVVAAAGNQRGDANDFTPANCTNVISVGSVSILGNRASYANTGSSVTLSSPGGDANVVPGDGVLSTVDLGTTTPAGSGYKMLNGTSMAAAQVSGIVSLLLSAQPTLSPAAVRFVLRTSAAAFPPTSSCTTALCGAGIVNAFAALQQITGASDPEPTQPVAPEEPVTPEPGKSIQISTLFLPLVSNRPITPALSSSNGITEIGNGGFEAGATEWQMTSSIGLVNLILNRTQLPADRTPHTGNWMSWLGGMQNEISGIATQIQVPAAPSQLVFWKRVKSSEADCGHDTAQVLINQQSVQQVLLCTATASTSWSRETVDLSAYAGQTVELAFQVSTDGTDFSSLFLDDLGFQAK